VVCTFLVLPALLGPSKPEQASTRRQSAKPPASAQTQ
jgi:hypothetical protein